MARIVQPPIEERRTPYGTWMINGKGYPRIRSGRHRGKYLHRVVWETLAGYALPDGWHIHHQDFNKLNYTPENLIAMPSSFNPTGALRCPYTGEFLSRDQYERRYVIPSQDVQYSISIRHVWEEDRELFIPILLLHKRLLLLALAARLLPRLHQGSA